MVAASLKICTTTGEFIEEYRILRPDGGQRWIHEQSFPIRDESGKLVRVAGLVGRGAVANARFG